MPIAERNKVQKPNKNLPLQIINKGPEFFRHQALRNQQRHPHGKSAAEQLAESRSQFLKRDSPTGQPLNDNSNNHVQDNRLASHKEEEMRRKDAELNVVGSEGLVKQEKISEIDRHESRRSRERNRDNRRGRRRNKGHSGDLNANDEQNGAIEKASRDSPEYDEVMKETRNFAGCKPEEVSGATDNTESSSRGKGSSSDGRPRPSVKEMVSKMGGKSESGNCNEFSANKTPNRAPGSSGRQRPKRTIYFASSESSETSPVLSRKAEHLTQSHRVPPGRGRDRTKPSIAAKPSSKVLSQKSPRGSRIQNVLNVFHQQASTSSPSPKENAQQKNRRSGAHTRGKSCPPTNRLKPSLADLLAKDAEQTRPRSKDLNDLDTLAKTESDHSSFVAVKARIRSFQTACSRSKPQPSERKVSPLSEATKSKDEQKHSIRDTSEVSVQHCYFHTSSPTPDSQTSQKCTDNSSTVQVERHGKIEKENGMSMETSDVYAIPNKSPKSPHHQRQHSASDISQSSSANEHAKKHLTTRRGTCSEHSVSDKVSIDSHQMTGSEDTGFAEQHESSKQAVHISHPIKPALPRKPDVSIVAKPSRYSYHVYETVPDPTGEPCDKKQPTSPDQKDNVFENPAHYSDPDEIIDKASPDPPAGVTDEKEKPDNVLIIKEDIVVSKEDQLKQASMFSTFSNHMRRLKGIIMRDKDQQSSQKYQSKATEVPQNEVANGKSEITSSDSRRASFQSPMQKKLAAQLGIDSEETSPETCTGNHLNNSNTESALEERLQNNEEEINKQLAAALESERNKRETDTDKLKNIKLMQPVHAKSFSWDDLKKKKLKLSLSEDNMQSKNRVKSAKGASEKTKTPPSGHFPMPHDKQKVELTKKLEQFFKQSKAYESGGDSPSKESYDSGKLKKKVSFDETTKASDNADKQTDKDGLIRKVSITPLTENYDSVEYNADADTDLVEETIILDSSNTIRLATPRSVPSSPTDAKMAMKKKISKMSEEFPVVEEQETISTGPADIHDDDGLVEVYSSTAVPESSAPPKPNRFLDREPSSDDNGLDVSNEYVQKTSKLLDFKKASISTDLDTSPTHDYQGPAGDSHVEFKHKSGTSSSGNARMKGEYDTSSRSDDCGLGATRGRVKHLKPYNARPFKNKNFSSDEDVIPEEHPRKSFWQTKAQLDLPFSRQRDSKPLVSEVHADIESSADEESHRRLPRSKSEPSNATAVQELDSFFDRMGLDDTVLEVVSKPHIYDEEEVFHEMHVWRTRGIHGSESDDSNTSYAMSETSNVSEEGVMNLRKFTKQLPDQSMSIVTKNARVIKWMCQCNKSRTEHVS